MTLREHVSVRRVVALLGVAALAGAGLVAYRTTVLPPPITRQLETVIASLDERLLILAIALLLGLYGYLTPWASRRRETDDPLAEREWEVAERTAPVAGAELTATIERRAASDVPFDELGDPIDGRLRDHLVTVFALELGDRAAAAEHVDAGDWTADPIAAAYVSDERAVDYPWYDRLYAWLYPGRAYQRRVSRALTAVERASAGRLSTYDAPDTRWRPSRSVLGWLGSTLREVTGRR